jgi:hypothetical protein
VQDPGHEPPGDPVPDHDQHAARERRLDAPQRSAIAQQRGGGDQDAEVEDQPLPVVVGGAGDRRPADRRERPSGEQREPDQREPGAGPAREGAAVEQRRDRDQHPGNDRGGDPRPVEVAAGVEGQHRRAREQHGASAILHPRPHRVATGERHAPCVAAACA